MSWRWAGEGCVRAAGGGRGLYSGGHELTTLAVNVGAMSADSNQPALSVKLLFPYLDAR